MTLQTEDLTFRYGSRIVLQHIDLVLKPGVTALIGPNAAGKSTLLKCLSGLLSPEGRLSLNGRDLSMLSRRERSRMIGSLPQSDFHRGKLTVFEMVLLGRLHDLSWRVSQSDIDAVQILLDEMSFSPLADRFINELSGGQSQLVALAQALVRKPDVLLLDEPTSNLDLRHQFEICTRVRDRTQSRDMITILSLHDLNLAARYADQIVVLNRGTIYSVGSPGQVLTAQMMSDVFQVDAEITWDATQFPQVSVRGPLSGNTKGDLIFTSGDSAKHP